MRALAGEAARTVRRGLREARRRRGHHRVPVRAPVAAPEPLSADHPEFEVMADDAELDALRGALVHELDQLAASDSGCSASFRRA
jgi:hypothetical protein